MLDSGEGVDAGRKARDALCGGFACQKRLREALALGAKRFRELLNGGGALFELGPLFFEQFPQLFGSILIGCGGRLDFALERSDLLADPGRFAGERIDFNFYDSDAVLGFLCVIACGFVGALCLKNRLVLFAPLLLKCSDLLFAFFSRARALDRALLKLSDPLRKHVLLDAAPLKALGHGGDLVREGIAPGRNVGDRPFGLTKLGLCVPGGALGCFQKRPLFLRRVFEFFNPPLQVIGAALFPDALLFLLGDLRGELVDRSLSIRLLHEVPENLRALALVIKFPPATGDLGFSRQALDLLGLRLLEHVHALQVLTGAGERAFGFFSALLVLANARGLFKVHAQLLGLGLDEVADHALADDGVGAGPKARAHEDVLNVAAPDLLTVDDVGVGAIARHHALDRELSVTCPGAAHAPVSVVKHHLNRGSGRGRSVGGAGKDELGH